jgi:glycosyltransferase involved in cell wall biosynthesis
MSQTSPPLISVIIPIYNAEKTIKETIHSILNQTFQNFEIIIIDDGSLDGSMKIVSEINDPRIRIFSQSNRGAAAARNKGFSVSRGERIAFLDADDLWEPEKLKTESNSLDCYPEADVAYCWVDMFDQIKDIRNPFVYSKAQGNILKQILTADIIQGGSNALIRRQALEAVGGFDESLKSGECWDVHIRLAKQFQYVLVPKPYVIYRISRISKSFKVLQMEKMCLRILNKTYDDVSEDLKSLKPIAIKGLYCYLANQALKCSGPKSRLIAAYFISRRKMNDFIWNLKNKKTLWNLRKFFKGF